MSSRDMSATPRPWDSATMRRCRLCGHTHVHGSGPGAHEAGSRGATRAPGIGTTTCGTVGRSSTWRVERRCTMCLSHTTPVAEPRSTSLSTGEGIACVILAHTTWSVVARYHVSRSSKSTTCPLKVPSTRSVPLRDTLRTSCSRVYTNASADMSQASALALGRGTLAHGTRRWAARSIRSRVASLCPCSTTKSLEAWMVAGRRHVLSPTSDMVRTSQTDRRSDA